MIFARAGTLRGVPGTRICGGRVIVESYSFHALAGPNGRPALYLKDCMYQELFRPVPCGAGPVAQAVTFPVPDAFQRLPVNLSPDEIRAMVRDLLG